jgi:hypothetical protein
VAFGTVKWFAPELGEDPAVGGKSNYVALAAIAGLLGLVALSVVMHRRLDRR